MIQEAVNRLTDKNKNNFNIIRLLAAVGVVITHSYAVLGRPEKDWLYQISHGLLSFSRLGVYVFFVISGFLITQSLERSSSILSFYWKRFLRIFPALVVVIFITVFVVGPLLTTLHVGDYFKNSTTYRYLGGLTLYRITHKLPGVFTDNLRPNTINASLWTLPYEWTCYVLLSMMFLFIKKQKRFFLLLSFFILMILNYFLDLHSGLIIPIVWLDLYHLLNYGLFFFSGTILYLYRDKIKFVWYYPILILILLWFSSFYNWGIYILYCFLGYLILYLATLKLPAQKFFQSRDYSYGMYIWAFLIQQILSRYFSACLNVWELCVLTILCTLPIAMFSWHLVEKPILQYK